MNNCACCGEILSRGITVQDLEEGEIYFCSVKCLLHYYGYKYVIPRIKDLRKNPKEKPKILLTSTGEVFYNIEEVVDRYEISYGEF